MSRLKYTIVQGIPHAEYLATAKNSEVFSKRSGRLCTYDTSSKYFLLTITNGYNISGYIDEDFTVPASGTYKFPFVTNLAELTFEMPYASAEAIATLTEALLDAAIGINCDIYTISGMQYCDAGQTSQKVLLPVGGDVDEGTLYVKVAPYYTAGTANTQVAQA